MATIKHFTKDSLINGNYELIEVDSVSQWIAENYMPGDAFSVFKGEPSQESLVENTVENLMALKDGEFVILDTPAEPATIAYVVALVVAVAVVVLTPKPELPSNVNRSQESPNNRLSSRSNQARPFQRIPDIKGEVLAIPDIAMPTYSTYENNIEVENGFYCVGRKQLQIEEIKDGDTPLELINGASAGVYYPNKNPNTDSPDIQIGQDITRDVVIPYRSNQVDGATLKTDADNAIANAAQTGFLGLAGQTTLQLINFSDPFDSSQYIVGSNVIFTDVILPTLGDISGIYEITAYTSTGDITIDRLIANPSLISETGTSGEISSENSTALTSWAYMTAGLSNSAIFNVIAQNGMYKDNGGADLISRTVEYEFEIETLDSNDLPTGSVTTLSDSITGNNQKLYGRTTEYNFSTPTKFRVRARRVTPRDTTFSGSVVDEIKWADLYGITELDGGHDFGDVTTIQTKTLATPFATAVKERQLNCLATEMLYVYEGSGVFSGTLTANKTAVQSLITDTIDPLIGNRELSEIDADALLDLNQEIIDYFGINDHTEFSYTYDSTEITYQEYAQQLLNAINSIGYRDNSIIKAIFERPKSVPTALFTHRSKIPDSERYTRNFNQAEIPDGLEFNWIDPNTNNQETIFIPSDRSAVSPKKFDIPGIRNEKQAIVRANREFNKIQFKKMTLDLTVTAEGRYLLPNDMFACVKGTRTYTQDGEVIGQSGLLLTLSQDVTFIPSDIMSITLKARDGSTENILCTETATPNQVLLNSPPSVTISTDIDSRRTEFSFGNDARHASQNWLSQEVDISDKLNVTIRAINYSSEYYKDDGANLSAWSDGFSDGFG